MTLSPDTSVRVPVFNPRFYLRMLRTALNNRAFEAKRSDGHGNWMYSSKLWRGHHAINAAPSPLAIETRTVGCEVLARHETLAAMG